MRILNQTASPVNMPKAKNRRDNSNKKFNAFSENTRAFSLTQKRLDFIDSDEDFYVDYSSEHVDRYEDLTSKTLVKKPSRRSTWTKAIHGKGMCHAFKNFIKNLPYNIWKSYIEALLIPRYRPEWGKYVKWNSKVRPLSAEERARLKRENSIRNRKFSNLSSSNKPSFTRKKRRRHYSRKRYATDRPPRPVQHDHSKCTPIRINIAGKIFEPQLRTLEQFPKTLLGDPRRMEQFYDPDRDEFFFDRHRSSFEAILYYYNSGGILRRPATVAHEIFLDEIKFYDLGPEVILSFQHRPDGSREDNTPLPKNLLKRKLWLLFEHPESSPQSRILAYISIAAVCMSIFEFCIETLPHFEQEGDDNGNIDLLDIRDPFFFTETICIIFFVVEYIMRAATSPHFFDFVKEITNIIDLAAIMPYVLNLVYYVDNRMQSTTKKQLSNQAVSLTVFRIIRLVRVFRILKLSRHNRGLKILGKTLKASWRELFLLMFFLMVGVVVFSSAMYFAESQYDNTPFTSIPEGFWFGVVTMTTLGYGDEVPVGPLGKIIGSICAIAGVLTISLPVPVIVSNFNMFYNSEEMNNPQAAASKTLPECDHVEHCPYYPAWYTRDGQVVGSKINAPKGTTGDNSVESYCAKWLMGEQKPDYSDSDFDELLKDDLLKHKSKAAPVKKRSKRSTSKKSVKVSKNPSHQVK